MAETSKVTATKNTDESKIFAAISYISLLSVVMYILKKDDSYVQFHAKQGIVLFGISLLGIVPFFGWIVAMIALVLMIIGAVKAYMGEKYRIPFIADLADKINF